MKALPKETQESAQELLVTAMEREDEPKPFTGVERRRSPGAVPVSGGIALDLAEGSEVSVFHELGKALTSSLQLDQVLRTIMEKINEVLRPDTWSLLLMDVDKGELFFQIATGKGAEALKDVRIKIGQGLAGWVAQTGPSRGGAGYKPGFAVLFEGGRAHQNGDAVDRGRAGTLPRSLPGCH